MSYIFRASRIYHTGIEDGQQFKIKIHPATSTIYCPHRMPLEKVLNHLLYIVVIMVTDEGSIYSPLSCNWLDITFAMQCFAITIAMLCNTFFKYQW